MIGRKEVGKNLKKISLGWFNKLCACGLLCQQHGQSFTFIAVIKPDAIYLL